MKNILILGAGKSSTSLIDYLARQAITHEWQLTVADGNLQQAQTRVAPHSQVATALQLDITHTATLNALIEKADIVVSLMPPALHHLVAANCVEAGKNLLTASYTDEAIENMAPRIQAKGLLFLCEMGLDPGIDHMSACQLIRQVQQSGSTIQSFYSHCGGLVAPESDDNPWHYKISWNPRNVVLAGKAGAVFRKDAATRQTDYLDLFDAGRLTSIPDLGDYAWYPNRNSLPYIELYGLDGIKTFMRTTLRHPVFCLGWKKIAALGLTDENSLLNTDKMSYLDFLSWHYKMHPTVTREEGMVQQMFAYLGLYNNQLIGKGNRTAADILQELLEQKLVLSPMDRDMVIMQHELEYLHQGKTKKTTSSLIVKGEDNVHTAMAKTVGLPLGIAVTLVLQQKINLKGLHIPILPEIYIPVLQQLQLEGIRFKELEE